MLTHFNDPFPNLEIFFELKPGTKIVILPGAGEPSTNETRVETVSEADFYFSTARTVEGTNLTAKDAEKIYLANSEDEEARMN